MNPIPLILLSGLLSMQTAQADNTRTVTSPDNRVAMLELYTSEGCSSCPPADRWLSRLRNSGISEQSLIPMAFHVTYWDYIGWKDSYGSETYDLRQRQLGRANKLSTIYTPQFVLDGMDFRRYKQFTTQVLKINKEKSTVDLSLSLKQDDGHAYNIDLEAETARASVNDIALFVAVVESNLSTAVEDGENEGETLKHDYVVRELYGPQFVSRPAQQGRLMQAIRLLPQWKRHDMNIVGFAQDLHSGRVLQAVSMPLTAEDRLSGLGAAGD